MLMNQPIRRTICWILPGLDLVITRPEDRLIENVKVKENAISDHHSITFSIGVTQSAPPQTTQSCRNLRAINAELFEIDLLMRLHEIDVTAPVNAYLQQYELVLQESINMHAPLVTKML